MKFIGLVLIILLSNVRLMAQNEQQLIVKLSNPGKPYKLNVDLTIGSIKLSTYKGKEIVIDVFDPSSQQKKQMESPKGMKQLVGASKMTVTAQENNNEVTVSDPIPKLVTLSIKVPANATSIKLSTIKDGNITVNGVSCALEIQIVNGSISAFNISGSVVASAVNGKLLVTFKAVDPKAAMAFSTLNGDIDVTFPVNLRANLKIRSDKGHVYSDFDLVADPSRPKATQAVKDGMYRLTMDDWIYGKVAGGGPDILLKNINGNIYIRKAK